MTEPPWVYRQPASCGRGNEWKQKPVYAPALRCSLTLCVER
uniref:Uncharacterized protein n=1 Tax=Anguilla anguilla TaxID=7936 RepID=A0A0E9PQK7_ANGAN